MENKFGEFITENARVVLRGSKTRTPSIVVGWIIDVPGGVEVSPAIENSRGWNLDDLQLFKTPMQRCSIDRCQNKKLEAYPKCYKHFNSGYRKNQKQQERREKKRWGEEL